MNSNINSNIEYRGYIADVKYNKKRNTLTARTEGLTGLWLYADGATMDELEKNYRDTVDQYIRYTEAAMGIRTAA